MKDRIKIVQGDITELDVDAIVNAANSSLMGGGGVDGAIHRKGGPAILKECKEIIKKIGSCHPGEAVITSGGNLPAKFVIHTVGPVWSGGKNEEAKTLISSYKKSLEIAKENEFKRVAFPNISTGVYNYPKDEAAAITIHSTIDFLLENKFPEQVVFCCFDAENYNWMCYFWDCYLKDT